MGNAYLWIKALHVVFVVGWFAGVLYLPRLYVHLAAVDDATTRARLLLMARKLLVFTSGLGLVAVVLGMWLLGQGAAMKAGWMQAKLLLVLVVIGYHAWCAVVYARLAGGAASRSPAGFRWFNEVPVLLLTAIVVLVIVKPF
jgi:putative membrane protein